MTRLSAFLLMWAVTGWGQATKPVAHADPWMSCVGHPEIENMSGGTEVACKKAGGQWKAVTATAQLIFTPEQQAAYPGNAWMKPCGKDNHDDACVEAPKKPIAPLPFDPSGSTTTTWCGKDSANCSAAILTVPPPGPCGWIGTWDEGKQVCSIHVTFGQDAKNPITCSPIAKDENGQQTMVCWYKPVPSTGGK